MEFDIFRKYVVEEETGLPRLGERGITGQSCSASVDMSTLPARWRKRCPFLSESSLTDMPAGSEVSGCGRMLVGGVTALSQWYTKMRLTRWG